MSEPFLRVLHLTPRLSRGAGGAWHYLDGLTRALSGVGVDCAVAGVVERGSTDPAMLAATQVVAGAPWTLPANYGVSRELSRRAAREIPRCDVIHAHGLRVGTDLLAMRLARAWRAPIVLSPHGQLNGSIAGRGRWKKRLVGALWADRYLRRVDAGLGVSDAEADAIRRALRPGVPVLSAPIGIDVDTYRSGPTGFLAAHAPRTRGRRVVLYLAHVHANKGVGRLADAWLDVCRDAPAWHLVIAGVDHASIGARAVQRLRDRGVGDTVTPLGPAFGEDQRGLLADANLFAMPSDAESFGIAFAESLASGVPIVATRGAPWSIAAERGCGWWVEPTVPAVAAALREATSLDAATLAAMGTRGRTLARERLGWAAIARDVRAFYERVLHG